MKLRDKLRWVGDHFGRANLWLYAASGAYYLFFSLGPLAVIILALMPYLPVIPAEELLEMVAEYAPPQVEQMVEQLVHELYAGSALAFGVGLIVEVWSAGQFFGLVMGALGHIYDGGHRGGYLRRRLLGALYTLILVALVLGNMALLFWEERLRAQAGPEESAFWALVLRSRGYVFMIALTVTIAVLFRYVPRRVLRLWAQLPGAAFSALTWLAFSRAYSWAVTRFSLFSVYGSLAIVIISLFWMYCSLYLLFMGAWLNALPAHYREHKAAMSPPAAEDDDPPAEDTAP